MSRLSRVAKAFLRFLTLWVVDGFSLLLTAAIFPGISFGGANSIALLEAFAAAFLLSIVNLMIRPLVLLLARPLGFIAVFVLGFLVNAAALLITSYLLPVFEVSGWLSAILGGLVFAAVNIVLTGVLDVNDEGSFYQGLIERLARRQSYADIDPHQRGLVMLEIDGLSYHHIKKALTDGRLPTLERLMRKEGYQLTRVDCGIPSQTSACQAGIMFGDNSDIPAFRWFDKDQQKLYVSGSDASELNGRYAQGKGLMRGGSSINNMLNGDAEKSLLTLAGLFDAADDEKKKRAEDVYLLMLNPYFLTRTIVLFLVDVLREVWEGWQQKRKDVQPRLNRMAHGYPFVRAATTVFMRDIAANLAELDIIRGAPSIYVTWPGYDEVAHHSGPWTSDAFKVLATYDSVIARVLKTIQDKAPRPYDLIILSDHGQSFGPTFKQRYGISLKEFIEQQLPQGTTVTQSMGGDTGVTSLTAVSGELENIQQSGVGGMGGRALAKRGQKVLDKNAKKQEETAGDIGHDKPAQVTAYGSGNLAQVYFDLYPRKIKVSELDAAYPGMVPALVAHPGIGIVCGYGEDGAPIVLGKQGQRNLDTGVVTGIDPLLLYAPADANAHGHADLDTRIWQVKRVMDFPHAGDLMVISTVYDDGTVAALEELIGNHGGLGGEQTDAFLFHPADMAVAPTRNSVDVFHILNNRREQPILVKEEGGGGETAVNSGPWSLTNLWLGLKDVKTWLPLAGRVMVFDRSAYQEVVADSRMTAPALLVGVGTILFTYLVKPDRDLNWFSLFIRVAAWFLTIGAVTVVGRSLSRQGNYTRTLRGLGFAHVVYLVELVALIPVFAPLAIALGTILGFISYWMGAATAHNTRGWRTIVLPFLAFIVAVLIPILVLVMMGSVVFSFESVFEQLGFIRGS
ncbi:MAG: phage holin family protein [Chloroflexota bacterium]